jgi:hypothetical protein
VTEHEKEEKSVPTFEMPQGLHKHSQKERQVRFQQRFWNMDKVFLLAHPVANPASNKL